MTTPIKLLGISGSLRQGSYNTGLIRAAAELLPPDVTLEVAMIADIPLYHGDVEAAGVPDTVLRFKEQIASADALLFAVPEYNYSVSGVLKNAIDWASRPRQTSPLSEKPAASMGAGGLYGAVRAQLHFHQIGMEANLHLINRPSVQVARAWEKFDTNGKLTDEAVRQQVGELVEALVAWARRLNPR